MHVNKMEQVKSRLKTVFILLGVYIYLSDYCFEGVNITIKDEISW